MASVIEESVQQDPRYINYLFTMKRYDCHFFVGNEKQSKPETIGVVVPMLMAHSEVLQSDMFCRDIEDKKFVTVNDIHPDTFRNLLRYVYGYDNTDTLSFDEADNLLYAADKYLIESLISRLVNRLVKMLNPDNICSLLNNRACYRQVELDFAITKILHLETKRVLDSPLFLELSSDALIKVFEQELLTVEEIEVWRAAVKWAKQQTTSENGQDLRKALEGPAKHIRVCTIDDDSFVNEVYPTGILTAEEVNMVYLSKVKKEKQSDLITFSNEVKYRMKDFQRRLDFVNHSNLCHCNNVTLDIYTKNWALELLPFFFQASWVGETNACNCMIIITRITDYTNNTSTESHLVTEACNLPNDKTVSIPVGPEGKNIVLQPNSKYRVSMRFNINIRMYFSKNNQPYDNEHMKVKVMVHPSVGNLYATPLKALSYKVCVTTLRA